MAFLYFLKTFKNFKFQFNMFQSFQNVDFSAQINCFNLASVWFFKVFSLNLPLKKKNESNVLKLMTLNSIYSFVYFAIETVSFFIKYTVCILGFMSYKYEDPKLSSFERLTISVEVEFFYRSNLEIKTVAGFPRLLPWL